MKGHSYKLHANGPCHNKFNWILTLKSKQSRSSKEYNRKRNKTQNYLHSLKYLLLQK